MKITWYGTASMMIEQNGEILLFDPFLRYGATYNLLKNYARSNNILVTHGHLDHISDIPKIVKLNTNAKVYCTDIPAQTLKKYDVTNIRRLDYGNRFMIGDFIITCLKGKHIKYDWFLAFRTIVRSFFKDFKTGMELKRKNDVFIEGSQTVVYEIKSNYLIQLLGSMNLDENTAYSVGADLLILPFQGRTDIVKKAVKIIRRLQPKAIMLDHFDNAFPPISSEVNTKKFQKMLKKKFSYIDLISLKRDESLTL